MKITDVYVSQKGKDRALPILLFFCVSPYIFPVPRTHFRGLRAFTVSLGLADLVTPGPGRVEGRAQGSSEGFTRPNKALVVLR